VHLKFEACAGDFAIVRCQPGMPVPACPRSGAFFATTRTDAELSIVCATDDVPANAQQCSRGWRLIRLVGPFDLGMTGVLLRVLMPLAGASVPVFAISTFDTDYVLVPAALLDTACEVLAAAGHQRVESRTGTAPS
jgi:hypothetical protein